MRRGTRTNRLLTRIRHVHARRESVPPHTLAQTISQTALIVGAGERRGPRDRLASAPTPADELNWKVTTKQQTGNN